MKFSVITVCFNDEKRIKKTLESVYKQTCRDFEHIIIDGKSEDNTLKYVRDYEKKYTHNQLKVISEYDNGIYDAMNKGIEMAKGDYICFMNAGDTFYDENVLNNVKELMREESEYDMYYGKAVIVYPGGQYRNRIIYNSKNTFYQNLDKDRVMPCHQAIFAKKKCFITNMFDVKYRLRAELKWFFKCNLNGNTIKGMDIIICKYEHGGTSDRIDSYQLGEIETNQIFEECNISREDNTRSFVDRGVKFACWFRILDKWLALKHSNKSFEEYFKKNGVKNIAIYGYGILGAHLMAELKETSVNISYIIDRDKNISYDNIPVFYYEDLWPEVDLVVVSVVTEYKTIYDKIRKKWDGSIISLDEILENMWYV